MQYVFPGLAAVSNVHPLFVHFPAALFPCALLLELLALWRSDAFLGRMARGLVYMGTVGAVAAVATGFIATAGMGHEAPGHDLVHIHRNFMVVTTVLAVVLSSFMLATGRNGGSARFVGTAGLILLVGILGLGADRGGRLVFKHGIGVRFVPPPASHHTHGEAAHEHGGEGEAAESHEHGEEGGEHGHHDPGDHETHGHEGGRHEH